MLLMQHSRHVPVACIKMRVCKKCLYVVQLSISRRRLVMNSSVVGHLKVLCTAAQAKQGMHNVRLNQ